MTVNINIQGATASEALDDLRTLAWTLVPHAVGSVGALTKEEIDHIIAKGPGPILGSEDKAQVAALGAANAPADPAKRGRGRPKKTTVADLPSGVVKEAEAAGVHVEDESRLPPELADDDGDEDGVGEADTPGAALTKDDVKAMILDLLNAMVAKYPDDPDIRTKTLKPVLDRLGAEKISLIDEAKYGDVPKLLAEIRDREGL